MIDEWERSITAFMNHNGLFQFVQLPLGLKKAPATFQLEMCVILSSVNLHFAPVYLAIILVFSKNGNKYMVLLQ